MHPSQLTYTGLASHRRVDRFLKLTNFEPGFDTYKFTLRRPTVRSIAQSLVTEFAERRRRFDVMHQPSQRPERAVGVQKARALGVIHDAEQRAQLRDWGRGLSLSLPESGNGVAK